ncbi:MAG: hypothetical protein Q7K28_00320 [Candidatus Wildermuthbacteria bacterium]|nr:hypothetical protein [Candidatus Wildermuthbacteria bacterium]
MEIPSYWKATCSREIEIRAGYLNKKQTDWWKDLMIKGMGQFYYENKIDWRKKEFLSIRVNSTMVALTRHQKKLKERYLVPFAGGRDSIVTLEGLKKRRTNIALFAVNPIEKIRQAIKVTGVKEQIIVRRIIDKKLLDLNKKGYLNGHTPFTSVLSFISVLCAVLFNYKNIAFSNEKSADEGNVKYLGKIMNHQWAKSAEFEKMFKDYVKKYLAKDINYFSFIRKYGELEISKMLIKYPKYFPVFSSCNAGMKINNKGGMAAKERWCGNCPKCLFVYMSLYPLLKEKELLKIFGRDIFQNKKLLPTLYGLLGQACPPKPGGRRRRSIKPLECVGTKAESQQALKLCLKKALGRSPATGEAQKSGKIPYLLTKI